MESCNDASTDDSFHRAEDPGAEQENNTLPSLHLDSSVSNQLTEDDGQLMVNHSTASHGNQLSCQVTASNSDSFGQGSIVGQQYECPPTPNNALIARGTNVLAAAAASAESSNDFLMSVSSSNPSCRVTDHVACSSSGVSAAASSVRMTAGDDLFSSSEESSPVAFRKRRSASPGSASQDNGKKSLVGGSNGSASGRNNVGRASVVVIEPSFVDDRFGTIINHENRELPSDDQSGYAAVFPDSDSLPMWQQQQFSSAAEHNVDGSVGLTSDGHSQVNGPASDGSAEAINLSNNWSFLNRVRCSAFTCGARSGRNVSNHDHSASAIMNASVPCTVDNTEVDCMISEQSHSPCLAAAASGTFERRNTFGSDSSVVPGRSDSEIELLQYIPPARRVTTRSAAVVVDLTESDDEEGKQGGNQDEFSSGNPCIYPHMMPMPDLAIGVTDDHSAAGASAVLSHRPSFVDRGRMFNPLASATRTEDTSSIHSASVADNEGAEINRLNRSPMAAYWASHQPPDHQRASRVCAYRRLPLQPSGGHCASHHHHGMCNVYRLHGSADSQTTRAGVHCGCSHATTHHCLMGNEGCSAGEPHVCHQHHQCSVRSCRPETGACRGHSTTCGNYVHHQSSAWHIGSPPLEGDPTGRRGHPRTTAAPHHLSMRSPSPAIQRTFSPISHSIRLGGPISTSSSGGGGGEMPPTAVTPNSSDVNQPPSQRGVVHGGSPYATSSGHSVPTRSSYHFSDAGSDGESYSLPRQPRAAHQHPSRHHQQPCPYDHFCPLQPDNGRALGDPFHASGSSVRPTVVAQPVVAFAPLSPAGVVGGAVSPVSGPFTPPLQPFGVMTGSFMTQFYTPTPPPAHSNPYTSSVQPVHCPPTLWPFVAPVPVHGMHHHHTTAHRYSMPFAGVPYYAHAHVPVVPVIGNGSDMSANAHLGDATRNDVGMAENSSFTSVRQPLMHTCGHRHQRPQLVYHRLRHQDPMQLFFDGFGPDVIAGASRDTIERNTLPHQYKVFNSAVGDQETEKCTICLSNFEADESVSGNLRFRPNPDFVSLIQRPPTRPPDFIFIQQSVYRRDMVMVFSSKSQSLK